MPRPVGGIMLSVNEVHEIVQALDELANLALRYTGQRLTPEAVALRDSLRDSLAAAMGGQLSRCATTLDDLPETHSECGYLDVVIAAERLGLKPDSVRAKARRGRLPAVRVNGRWLIRADAVPTL